MLLLTKEIRERMPRLYTTEETPGPDKIVQVKYFTPDSSWTWYAVEGDVVTHDGQYHPLTYIDQLNLKIAQGQFPALDIQDVILFGFVEGLEREWGYFSLYELSSARGKLGLYVERDLYQDPAPLREIRPDLFSPDDSA